MVESIEIDGLEPGPEGGRWRWPDPHTLVAMYNAFTPDNVSAVVSFAGARVDATRRMLRLFPKLEWWLEVFRQYHRSKFLSGLTRPTQGHEAFTPDFDWLMARGKDRIENAVKVHDGRYLR